MVIFWYLLLPLVTVSAREYSDTEVLQRLPKYFHLDDYERCLARRSGLYCVGMFTLSPTKHPHPTYDFMKAYSSNTKYHLNRTRICRGYCVSSRCPLYTGNATSRFERCVADWARPRSFRADLHRLYYCKTGADAAKPKPLDTAELAFLCVVVAILALNVVGTIYDYYCKDSSRGSLLRMWSISANWKKLVNMEAGPEPRLEDLAPAYGIKTIIVIAMVLLHGMWISFGSIGFSAHKLERLSQTTFGKLPVNGGAFIIFLLTLSAFLMSYSLLLVSEKITLSLKMLPMCLMKRMFRITPLLILSAGYAATFLARAGDGPLWYSVEQETKSCRLKFWTFFFYLSEILNVNEYCIRHTWGLTVDMQLSIITCSVTLVLARLRRRALPIIAALIIMSCFANTILGYIFEWGPFREIITFEAFHTRLVNISAFNYFYTQAWGGLPSSLIGVFAAHLYYELQAEKYDMKQNKWFNILASCSFPGTTALAIILGHFDSYFSRSISALFVGFERPIMSVFCMFMFCGVIVSKGTWHRFLSHSAFKFLGRLTLPIVIVGAIIEFNIVWTRSLPNSATFLDTQVDGIATYVLSVLIAIPLSVMVEIPARRLLDALMYARIKKVLANRNQENDNKSKAE